MKKLLMGNEAAALGALDAGVGVITGYPGTPSTEVLSTAVKYAGEDVYIEWSVNEKAALEVGAGAAWSGERVLITMKQVGLNACADPVMSLSYLGVKGGTVLFVADDPGPISSQTEQDTRTFGQFSKLPVLDPSSPEEMYSMMRYAFELSEAYGTPVILRPTTRVCHATSDVERTEAVGKNDEISFEKDGKRVIFPRLSFEAHKKIESRNASLSDIFSEIEYNKVTLGDGKHGYVCGGISYAYTLDALAQAGISAPLLRIGTPFPFPDKLAADFLGGLDEVAVFEELDPFIERELTRICGKYNLRTKINGKLNGVTPTAGELSVETIQAIISGSTDKPLISPTIKLPVRPPVLCAGCPHRASFYDVKRAMKGRKAVFCGDIGCYTLGNAMPLNMVDTCLCMGADITVAQGIKRASPDTVCFSFIGDSTFFHSGMTGVANAVYNQTDIVVIILDNSTTAMTGHQPNPGTGATARGVDGGKIDIPAVLTALGVKAVMTVDPFDVKASVKAVKKCADTHGVTAIVFKSPCIFKTKPSSPLTVGSSCIGCRICIDSLGCPALSFREGKAVIDPSLCTGCGLCSGICPSKAIS